MLTLYPAHPHSSRFLTNAQRVRRKSGSLEVLTVTMLPNALQMDAGGAERGGGAERHTPGPHRRYAPPTSFPNAGGVMQSSCASDTRNSFPAFLILETCSADDQCRVCVHVSRKPSRVADCHMRPRPSSVCSSARSSCTFAHLYVSMCILLHVVA